MSIIPFRTVVGTLEDDELNGISCDETIFGFEGNDIIRGDGGDDIIYDVQGGFDTIFGGSGDDTITIGDVTQSSHDEVYGGAGDDYIIIQGGFNNVVSGDDGNDIIDGTGGGDSLLSGSLSFDVLVGGEGDDQIYGDLGIDIMVGGSGSDIFALGNDETFTPNVISGVFYNSRGAGDFAYINDFDLQNDIIQLFGTQDQYQLLQATIRFNGNPSDNPDYIGSLLEPLNDDVPDALILYQDELIGIVRNSVSLNLRFLGNSPPIIRNNLIDQTAIENQPFNFTFALDTFDDVDGDTLSYSASLSNGSALPSWLEFNGSTRSFIGTPLNNDVSAFNITVIARDPSGATVSDTFTLTVENVNDEPTLDNPIADQSTSEDQAFNFLFPNNTFSDIDAGDTLTYSTTLTDDSALPNWLTFDANTQAFSGTPANEDVGSFDIKVIATDNAGATAEDTFTLTVENVNDAPTLNNPIANQIVNKDQPFTFTIPTNTFNDIDAEDTLIYTATLADGTPLPSWLSFDNGSLTFSGTPTDSEVGSLAINVQATDNAGESATTLFQLDVLNLITATDQIVGETGTVTDFNHISQTIAFEQSYINPVVFAQPLSFQGGQPSIVRITEVTETGFTAFLQEPSNLDGTHLKESFHYVVLEAGTWELDNSALLEVGTVNTNAYARQNWESIDFENDFVETPAVFSQVQTFNEADFVKTRNRSADTEGFQLTLEEEEQRVLAGDGHASEEVGYFAMSTGTGTWNGATYLVGNTGNAVTHRWHDLAFNNIFDESPQFIASIATYNGADPSALRYRHLDNNQVQIKIEEDTSFDSSIYHIPEEVNFLALAGNESLAAHRYDPVTGKRIITGTDANDFIRGSQAEELIYGGQGNDRLEGLLGADIFVIASDESQDTIVDFESHIDKIGLTGSLSFGALTITQSNQDTLISFNDNEIALIQGIDANTLTESDFITIT